ncbi:hypothetical protein HDU96_002358, partial [Phlyctochytrium bullatum]
MICVYSGTEDILPDSLAHHRTHLVITPGPGPVLGDKQPNLADSPRTSEDSDDADEFFDAEEDPTDVVSATPALLRKKSQKVLKNAYPRGPTGRAFALVDYAPGPVFGARLTARLASPTISSTRGRFAIPQHPPPLNPPSPTSAEAIQSLRYATFSNSWRVWLRRCAELLYTVRPRPDLPESDPRHGGFGPALFEACKGAKRIEELPELYVEWSRALTTAIAVTAENVLDDKGWRDKVRFIWSKMPITLIVVSLRLVNPVPFVERLLKLFVWRPSNMPSLLMRLAAIVCGSSHTQSQLKTIRSKLPGDVRAAIDAYMDRADNLHSLSPDAAYIAVLTRARIAGFEAPDPDIEEETQTRALAYARLVVRAREKEEFVAAIGSQGVTDFIVHFAQSIPGLLQEMWDCTDMAVLASKFFDVVMRWLEILKTYDASPIGSAGSREEYLRTIEAMDSAVWVLFEAGYPMVHTLANRQPVGPGGIHAIIDFIAREFGVTLLNDPHVEANDREEAASLAASIPAEARREAAARARWSFALSPTSPATTTPRSRAATVDPTPLTPAWVPRRKYVLHLGCPTDRLLASYATACGSPAQLWADASVLVATLDAAGPDERNWGWGFSPNTSAAGPRPSEHLTTTAIDSFREIMVADFFGREGRGWEPRPSFGDKAMRKKKAVAASADDVGVRPVSPV